MSKNRMRRSKNRMGRAMGGTWWRLVVPHFCSPRRKTMPLPRGRWCRARRAACAECCSSGSPSPAPSTPNCSYSLVLSVPQLLSWFTDTHTHQSREAHLRSAAEQSGSLQRDWHAHDFPSRLQPWSPIPASMSSPAVRRVARVSGYAADRTTDDQRIGAAPQSFNGAHASSVARDVGALIGSEGHSGANEPFPPRQPRRRFDESAAPRDAGIEWRTAPRLAE